MSDKLKKDNSPTASDTSNPSSTNRVGAKTPPPPPPPSRIPPVASKSKETTETVEDLTKVRKPRKSGLDINLGISRSPKKDKEPKNTKELVSNGASPRELKDLSKLPKKDERLKRDNIQLQRDNRVMPTSLDRGIDKKTNSTDVNKKKVGGNKTWLWIMLAILVALVVVFTIWGREIFQVPITYKINPDGNVIEIKSPNEDLTTQEFRFMPGDNLEFTEPLYLVHHVRDPEGEFNNMFTFRFKAYLDCGGEKFNVIDAVNDGTDARFVKLREYWYFSGIILPNEEPVDILNSISIDINLVDNTLSGKKVQLVLELETVYPLEEQINEKFGNFPPGWYNYVTTMQGFLSEKGYR